MQRVSKTKLAYCGSLRSGGQSGKSSRDRLAVLHIALVYERLKYATCEGIGWDLTFEDLDMRIERINFVERAKCRRSIGSR